MRFTQARLQDAMVIDLERREDSRGYFARAFCEAEFAAAGLETRFVQANAAGTLRKGTIRGLHYQLPPHEEVKVIRCTRGAIYDVLVDLRPESSSYGRWQGFEIDATSGRMIYVPRGFAHGYQTLEPDTEVFYLVSHAYTPGAESGLCYNDPAFGIVWPLPVSEISVKDRTWPPFRELSGRARPR
jgi:dTDP-4-dehydrorhamnose 3,5-epimerase